MRQIFFAILTAVLVGIIAVLLWRYTHETPTKGLKDALPITRYTLSNGLDVVVIENHRTPVVGHTMFVKVGSIDDPAGKTGIAHFLEHMLFKGTTTVNSGEYDRRISALGGENNAYTTTDYTAYYVNAPVKALEQVMALESDRFMNLVLKENEAEMERKVVEEERRMRVDSDPGSLLTEQMNAAQFLSHPYRVPIIGWEHDIATFTAADVAAHLKAYYRPSNMVLVVAGDVEPKEVRRLAMRYFGPMKNERPRARVWAGEPTPIAAKTVTYADPRVQQPQWVRQYLAPSFGQDEADDVIALELASQWLGGGRTGVLYQALVVEQKLAVSVSVDYYGTRIGPGIFTVSAVPQDGVSLKQLGEAVDAALARALAAGPDAESVARAKTLYTASITYAQDGLTPVASYIGALLMIGKDEQLFYGLGQRIDAATAERMLSVAKKTIVPAGSVTGELMRKEMGSE